MSYKIRNSIALGILFLLIMGVGTYIRAFNLPRKAKTIEKQVKQIDEELQNTPNLVNQFNDLSALLTDTQKRWENRNKDIPPVDITSQSYAYFSRLIDLSGYVKLDMVYNGLQSHGNYGYNVYNLKGEAPFDNFYRFIWYLENDRKLYKITDDYAEGNRGGPHGEGGREGSRDVRHGRARVLFFCGRAFQFDGERSITPNTLNVDPFTPVISSGIPPNTRALVELERSDLKAVITGKAYVLDQENNIRTLQEGDEIYLGYVTKIDPEGGRIEGR